MEIQLTNRSKWPTPLLRVLCRWVARREPDLPRGYSFLFRATKYEAWRGRGGRFGQKVTMSTRYRPYGSWPYDLKDHRFKWAPTHVLGNRLETLVFLIAHEAHHSTDGSRSNFRTGRRCNVASMEFRCNEAGMKAVLAMRAEWPKLRAKIIAAMKAERKRVKDAKLRAAKNRSGPSPKLEAARSKVAEWQRKAKLANTKIKKYRQRVRYYEGRLAAMQKQ